MDWSDNLDEIHDLVEQAAGGFDFEATVAGRLVADELLDVAVQTVRDRSLTAQAAPGGDPWAANAEKYAERKDRAGIVVVGVGPKTEPGERMLSLVQLKGRRTIGPAEATAAFGQSTAVNRKGQWFTAGSTAIDGCEPSGAKGQPPRPFYALDADGEAAVVAAADELLGRFLGSL